jgi:hypothetical protein
MNTDDTKQVGVVSLMICKKLKACLSFLKPEQNFLWDISENSGNYIFAKDHMYTYFRINAYLHHVRGGRSANRSQSRKFADLKNMLICGLTKYVRLADLPEMEQFGDPIFFCNLQICDLRTQCFGDLKLLQIHIFSSRKY